MIKPPVYCPACGEELKQGAYEKAAAFDVYTGEKTSIWVRAASCSSLYHPSFIAEGDGEWMVQYLYDPKRGTQRMVEEPWFRYTRSE